MKAVLAIFRSNLCCTVLLPRGVSRAYIRRLSVDVVISRANRYYYL